MEHLIVPAGYEPAIDLRETQIAIKIIKDFFSEGAGKAAASYQGVGPSVRFARIGTER